jgi:hypothetical protein
MTANTPDLKENQFIFDYLKKSLGLDDVLDTLWLEFENIKIRNPASSSWVIPQEYTDTINELYFLVATYINYIKSGLNTQQALNIVRTNYAMWQSAYSHNKTIYTSNELVRHENDDCDSDESIQDEDDLNTNVQQFLHNSHMIGQYLERKYPTQMLNLGATGSTGPTGPTGPTGAKAIGENQDRRFMGNTGAYLSEMMH